MPTAAADGVDILVLKIDLGTGSRRTGLALPDASAYEEALLYKSAELELRRLKKSDVINQSFFCILSNYKSIFLLHPFRCGTRHRLILALLERLSCLATNTLCGLSTHMVLPRNFESRRRLFQLPFIWTLWPKAVTQRENSPGNLYRARPRTTFLKRPRNPAENPPYQLQRLPHNLLHTLTPIHHHRIPLPAARSLQASQLLPHHSRLHEMPLAGPHPPQEDILVGVQVEEMHAEVAVLERGNAEHVAVFMLQGGAGNHHAPDAVGELVDGAATDGD